MKPKNEVQKLYEDLAGETKEIRVGSKTPPGGLGGYIYSQAKIYKNVVVRGIGVQAGYNMCLGLIEARGLASKAGYALMCAPRFIEEPDAEKGRVTSLAFDVFFN